MRTETITVEYYEFNELSKEAKKKALSTIENSDWYSADNIFTSYKDIVEKWEKCLEKLGFLNCKINWSGFCSQGDGASFTADIDSLTMINTLIMEGSDYKLSILERLIYHGLIEENISVRRINNHYYHENSCSLDKYFDWDFDGKFTNDAEEYFDNFMLQYLSDLEDFRENLCVKIYAELKQSFEWFFSDEGIKNYIQDYDLEFNKEGTIVYHQ